MSASVILYVAMGYAVCREGRVEQLRVLVFHHRVILAVYEEYRGAVGFDVPLQRQGVAHNAPAFAVFAQQSSA